MRITVDASVAVKWLVAEPYREQARQILAPDIERHAPALLVVECASAIWRKAERGEFPSVRPFLDEIVRLSDVIRLHPDRTLVRDAVMIAQHAKHPVYDCLYVACARLTGSVLVTADRRLADIASHGRPAVRTISLDAPEDMATIGR